MVQEKIEIRLSRVCVIMRQNNGRQDNLSHHAEYQHVFVLRHRCGIASRDRKEEREEGNA